jgi:hypothetical protein
MKALLPLLLLIGGGAYAATLRMYTPGGAPCAGLCSYEWAREQFNVPEGIPERMTIPVGSIVTQMSYSKNGVAYAIPDSAILAEDEPGQGYFFTVDGVTYMMVQLDACQNWAVMLPPKPGLSYGPDETVNVQPVGYTPVDWTPGGGGGGCWNCGGGGGNPPPDNPPPTPEVPVPTPFVLLFTGLVVLLLRKRR